MLADICFSPETGAVIYVREAGWAEKNVDAHPECGDDNGDTLAILRGVDPVDAYGVEYVDLETVSVEKGGDGLAKTGKEVQNAQLLERMSAEEIAAAIPAEMATAVTDLVKRRVEPQPVEPGKMLEV